MVYGTDRFCSPWCHEQWLPSRRDDLYSIAYTAIYLRDGSLPWQGLQDSATTRDRLNAKRAYLNTCDPATKAMLSYVESLAFDTTPDYEQFAKLVRRAVSVPPEEDPTGSWWI